MTAAAIERMSRVDTAWLRMDNDVNLMMIVGVWLLTPAIPLQALRAAFLPRCVIVLFLRGGQVQARARPV